MNEFFDSIHAFFYGACFLALERGWLKDFSSLALLWSPTCGY